MILTSQQTSRLLACFLFAFSTHDRSVHARFTRRFSVNATAVGNGRVVLMGKGTFTPRLFDEGSRVHLRAIAGYAWWFNGWFDERNEGL